jgi:formate/nitrite transporter FocA (FNT family)
MQLKPFEKMTAMEVVVFWLMAACSGVMVGIGGVSSLLASVWLGEWGRLVGAVLFSLGIFTIVAYEMKLFTGMVADIPNIGLKNCWKLPVCFISNATGVGIVALLAYYSPIGSLIVERSQSLISAKLLASDWALRALCSSILCGILITVSVRCRHYTQQKGLSSTLGVTFPIIVFAFCGFDHSVANMLHFFYLGQCSWHVVGYILITIVGNLIGGVTFPIITKIRKYAESNRAEQKNEVPHYVDD